MLKKYFFILLLFVVCYSISYAIEGYQWRTMKSRHFIVYFKNVPDHFLDKTIEKSEYFYDAIAESLGLRRYDFWLWDNRAKIYIYDDADEYRLATGQPSWSYGCAHIQSKEIYTFSEAKEFFELVLAHELGHIIFREFVGFQNKAVPLCFDEGVASYQEERVFSTARSVIQKARAEGRFMDVNELCHKKGQLKWSDEEASIFYAESVSLIDFLVTEYGKDNFVYFCQVLRDTHDLQKALSRVYSFRDLKELDTKWQKHLFH